MVPTFLSLPSESSSKEMEKLKDSPMPKDQEDSDQRELLTLEKLSSSERPMMSESTLLEDQEKPERVTVKFSTKPPTSKDSSPKRELEERSSTREPESTLGKPTRRLTSPTRNSSPNISRRRKLPRKPPSQLQRLKLPQLKLPQSKLLQSKPLQPKKRRKLERKERSE